MFVAVHPKNSSKVVKNNYDFLKLSQALRNYITFFCLLRRTVPVVSVCLYVNTSPEGGGDPNLRCLDLEGRHSVRFHIISNRSNVHI